MNKVSAVEAAHLAFEEAGLGRRNGHRIPSGATGAVPVPIRLALNSRVLPSEVASGREIHSHIKRHNDITSERDC